MNFGDVYIIPFSKPRMSFLGHNRFHFLVDGKELYVNGWNLYWLMEQSVEDSTRNRVKTMPRRGAEMGLTVVRAWAFNNGR